MQTKTTSDILAQAQQLAPELVRLRRHIHTHPDLSFNEQPTAKLVAETLAKHGYQPKFVAGGIAVVAEIGSGEKTIAVRADMDALPIEETNTADYCSQNKGAMHACGHDVHTACVLGAAMLLAQTHKRQPIAGRVRFLFQPAEELTNSDGISGASLMINEGVLDGVSSAIALHVFPTVPVGSVALKSGPLLAACDSFEIRITGKGTHAAFPELGVDAVVIASHVVQAIQTITSRRKSALDPAVVTLGGIRSTTFRPNIVAEEVEIVGTARYFNNDLLALIKEELTKCCQISEAMGGSFTINYYRENPVLNNDSAVTACVRTAAQKILGEQGVREGNLELGAEDFSFIADAVPSCFVFLGAEIAGDQRKLHTSTFDIDERSIPFGTAVLAEAALALLDR
jgi:amidohydrolase